MQHEFSGLKSWEYLIIKKRKSGSGLAFCLPRYYFLVETFDGDLSSVSRVAAHFEKRDE
jgi:hypothetical protein